MERQDTHKPAVERHTAAELRAMIERLKGRRESYGALAAKQALGAESIELVADKGYYSGEEVKKCEDEGVVTYVPKARVSPKLKKELFTNGGQWRTSLRRDRRRLYLPDRDAIGQAKFIESLFTAAA